ncbi:unnamed protein product [Soboliphyme baturini]|uniref:LisH domain-containing protein n=1 Tax=Soboliphyme baturini TaxID=241478 RepID=A0A183I9U9_9BILA|nr:unnamed protein product [Soboliphyme baturini]
MNVTQPTSTGAGATAVSESKRSSSTSDETEMSCDEDHQGNVSSSPYSSESGDESGDDASARESDNAYAMLIQKYIQNNFLQLSPEEFAQRHNMMLPDGVQSDILVHNDEMRDDDDESIAAAASLVKLPQLFAVDLGKRQLTLADSYPPKFT